MTLLVDAFWRAAAYTLHPRVIAGGLLTLGVAVAAVWAGGLPWAASGVSAVRTLLEAMVPPALREASPLQGNDPLAQAALAVLLAPLAAVLVMSLVTVVTLPPIAGLVARRRFPGLQRRGGWLAVSVARVLVGAGLALTALVLTIPLWAPTPLFVLLPPLIVGWLAHGLLVFGVLAPFATRLERAEIGRCYRAELWVISGITGSLSLLPAIAGMLGFLMAMPVLVVVPLAVSLHVAIFVFAALWFSHYGLSVLAALHGFASIQQIYAEID